MSDKTWRNGLQGRLKNVEDSTETLEASVAAVVAGADPATMPPLLRVQRVVTAAEMGTIFSAPIVIVPAVAGVVPIPEYGVIHRLAGTAYTAGSFTRLAVVYTTNTALLCLSTFDAGAFTGTISAGQILSGPVTATANNGFTNISVTGGGLQIQGQGGNPTPGTGSVVVTMFYRVWAIPQP